MKQIINITKALSNENRIRILMALLEGELCVCQITALLNLAPSTISKHISVLRQAGLVKSRKDAQWVYYSIETASSPLIKKTLKWLENSLKNNSVIQDDDRNLKNIKKSFTKDMKCK